MNNDMWRLRITDPGHTDGSLTIFPHFVTGLDLPAGFAYLFAHDSHGPWIEVCRTPEPPSGRSSRPLGTTNVRRDGSIALTPSSLAKGGLRNPPFTITLYQDCIAIEDQDKFTEHIPMSRAQMRAFLIQEPAPIPRDSVLLEIHFALEELEKRPRPDDQEGMLLSFNTIYRAMELAVLLTKEKDHAQ